MPNILLNELVVVSNSCSQQEVMVGKFIDLYTRFRSERWWSANLSESHNFEADEYILHNNMPYVCEHTWEILLAPDNNELLCIKKFDTKTLFNGDTHPQRRLKVPTSMAMMELSSCVCRSQHCVCFVPEQRPLCNQETANRYRTHRGSHPECIIRLPRVFIANSYSSGREPS